MKKQFLVMLVVAAAFLYTAVLRAESSQVRKFNLVTLEVNGVKFWQPSLLVVKEGDEVEIHASTRIKGKKNGQIHGLSIPDLKIEEIVDAAGKVIKFKANKAGIYNLQCHLHPAHIGGQLLVLED